MKTCSRWRSRHRFTSGLYKIENSGSLAFSLGVIRSCSEPEFVDGLSAVVSGIAAEIHYLSDPRSSGIERCTKEVDVPPAPALSIGGRERRRPWNIRRQNGAD